MVMVLAAGENQVVRCVMSLEVVDKCGLVLLMILEVAMKAVVVRVTSLQVVLEVVVKCVLVLVLVMVLEVVKDAVVLVMVSIDEMSQHHARSCYSLQSR